MEIQVEDIEIGDDILFSLNSKLYYVHILEKPRQSKKRTSWYTGKPQWIPVKGTSRIVEIPVIRPTYNGGTYTYKYSDPELTDKDHNFTKKWNLDNRTIWLVKKANKL